MSKRKPISQREARDLKRRVAELEALEDRRRNAWANTFPNGAHIATVSAQDTAISAVRTARLLRHAVVVAISSDGRLSLHALPLGSRA